MGTLIGQLFSIIHTERDATKGWRQEFGDLVDRALQETHMTPASIALLQALTLLDEQYHTLTPWQRETIAMRLADGRQLEFVCTHLGDTATGLSRCMLA